MIISYLYIYKIYSRYVFCPNSNIFTNHTVWSFAKCTHLTIQKSCWPIKRYHIYFGEISPNTFVQLFGILRIYEGRSIQLVGYDIFNMTTYPKGSLRVHYNKKDKIRQSITIIKEKFLRWSVSILLVNK